MSLTSGMKLGPYEVVSPLGAGGMGEVYRARDTRLERDVAIKVLPTNLSSDPSLRERLEREAKAVSKLAHPHICTLYDIGHQDGVDFLVMELVEGETLERRLTKGPLPPEQVLRCAAQVADALAKAHKLGITHRDLKPSNVMLTKTGAKLMDFGLAKQAAPAPLPAALGMTAETKLTCEGTIVGTFRYLAPEQLEAKEADARTDIFALGEMIYEMATGKPAFSGKSRASLIAAILTAEPASISQLQPLTPPGLERIVKKCLAKDPDERWQSASDLASELNWIAERGFQGSVTAERWSNRERILMAVALSGAIGLISLGVLYWNRAPADVHAIRAYLMPSEGTSFVLTGAGGFAVSPDGLLLAYVASMQDGKSLLWVRPIDSLQGKPLAGTEGAGLPFWSPDSRFIGFFAGGKLKKIEASGGPALTLCETPFPRGGTWNRDGVILFAPSPTAPLYRISASGGTATPVTALDPSKNEIAHRWPYFLPDGHHFLYLAGLPYSIRENPTTAIRVGSLDSTPSKLLVPTHASAIYASGHILFLRQNTLMAQPFDTKKLELTGDAIPVEDPVMEDTSIVKGVFSASENGRLTYVRSASTGSRQLNWVDRSGRKIGQVPGADAYAGPQISPDGKTIVYTLISPGYDIWSYDVARKVKTRLTFGSASTPANAWAVWAPDGRWIAYTCVRNGKYGLCRKLSDGSGTDEVLLEGTELPRWPGDWSPDGKSLIYSELRQGTTALSWLPLSGERKPYPFRQSNFNEGYPQFSPNGKWVAYCSDESGEDKIYVVPFPGPGGKWQVSPGGGCRPRWRRDGKELFYLSSDNKVMAAEVKAGGFNFEAGTVHALFEARFPSTTERYDVTADGQRFIVVEEAVQPGTTITLVVNWTAELKKQ
jgi:Tol biopolymer transport system component/predicted Ser/Thr protein kinase